MCNTYYSHQYECRLNLLRLYGPDSGRERRRHRGGGNLFLIHLALRSVLQRPPTFFLSASTDLFSLAAEDRVPSDPYAAYFSLTCNARRLDPLCLCAAAVFMLGCLDRCGYLATADEEDAGGSLLSHFADGRRRSPRVFFCHLLLVFYAAVQSNNHAVQEVSSVDARGVGRTILGNAVFPHAASCLNHSCDPNTAPVVLAGSLRQATVAARCIEEGEEITHVYQVRMWLTSLTMLPQPNKKALDIAIKLAKQKVIKKFKFGNQDNLFYDSGFFPTIAITYCTMLEFYLICLLH